MAAAPSVFLIKKKGRHSVYTVQPDSILLASTLADCLRFWSHKNRWKSFFVLRCRFIPNGWIFLLYHTKTKPATFVPKPHQEQN
eukprot:g38171.t1